MKRIVLLTLLLATPALAQEAPSPEIAKANDTIIALRDQRDAAMDQVAIASTRIVQAQRDLADADATQDALQDASEDAQ